MRLLFLVGAVLVVSGAVVGCKSSPQKVAVAAPVTVTESRDQSASAVNRTKGELTSEMVYSLLLGEIASQRGDMKTAHRYELEAANLTKDPVIAERAVRFAMHRQLYTEALAAVDVWGALAPNDLAAQQLVVVLKLKQDKAADVMAHLRKIIEISEGKGENGYLNAMAALNRELSPATVIEQLRQIVGLFPDSAKGRYALAIAALMAKDHPLAIREGSDLVARYPDWANGYLVLGRIYVAVGKAVEARALMARAVEQLPNEALLMSAYARLLVEAKELPLAFKYYNKMAQINPNDEGANYWLGLISVELKKVKEARHYFGQLIKLKKRTDAAAFFLGRIAETEEEQEEALKWYRKVYLGEFREQAQMGVVRVLASLERMGEARDWLKGMRIQHPKQAIRLYLMEAEMLRDHGTPADAMALFDQALQAHPISNELLYARGLYAATVDRLDILEQDMRQVIKQDPKHADALNALGYTLADQTDRYGEALELISQALSLKPDAPAVLDSMGWVHYRLGNTEESLKYLQRAYAKLPDGEIAAHLGEVLWVTGDQERANKVWQGALIESPKSKHVLEAIRRLKQ